MRPKQIPSADRRIPIAFGLLATVLSLIGAQHLTHSRPAAPLVVATR
jgi:hypothetical protein